MLAEQIISQEQEQILIGLMAEKKTINPKYFYDHKGSQLFEKITQLDEYYPTRTEISILKKYANEISSCMDERAIIVEPGAGSCEKVQYLLEQVKPAAYVPQDVSRDFLSQSTKGLSEKFPWLQVSPIVSDFSQPIALPKQLEEFTKYVFYPGSTIGNFDVDMAIKFLVNMRSLIGHSGGILLGVDLHKDSETLEAAYNDSLGVTAEFNLNVLDNINSLMDGSIDSGRFLHKAFYNTHERRIEMHLESQMDQVYDLLNERIEIKKGETIHTENSYKYSLTDIEKLSRKAGLRIEKTWVDDNRLFSLNYLRPM